MGFYTAKYVRPLIYLSTGKVHKTGDHQITRARIWAPPDTPESNQVEEYRAARSYPGFIRCLVIIFWMMGQICRILSQTSHSGQGPVTCRCLVKRWSRCERSPHYRKGTVDYTLIPPHISRRLRNITKLCTFFHMSRSERSAQIVLSLSILGLE